MFSIEVVDKTHLIKCPRCGSDIAFLKNHTHIISSEGSLYCCCGQCAGKTLLNYRRWSRPRSKDLEEIGFVRCDVVVRNGPDMRLEEAKI